MRRGNSMSLSSRISSPPFTRSILYAATFLLENVSSEYSNADELYEKAVKGGLKGYEIRSREWFSGENPETVKP